jgi:hypothetical protein
VAKGKRKAARARAEETEAIEPIESDDEELDESDEPEQLVEGSYYFPSNVAFIQSIRYAWRIYKAQWHAVVGLYTFLYCASAALTFILLVSQVSDAVIVLARTILSTVIGSMAVAVSSPMFADQIAGITSPIAQGLRVFRERRRDVIAISLLSGLLTTFLIMLGGIIGVLISLALLGPPMLAQVVTVEEGELSTAWMRTRLLMKFEWGRVVMYLINISLTIGFFVYLVTGYVSYWTRDANDTLAAGVFLLLEAVLLGILVPFIGAIQTVLYVDVRVRKEGLEEDEWITDRSGPTPSTQD